MRYVDWRADKVASSVQRGGKGNVEEVCEQIIESKEIVLWK